MTDVGSFCRSLIAAATVAVIAACAPFSSDDVAAAADPSFSPNGEEIAYAGRGKSDQDIFVVDTRTNRPARRLTGGGGHDWGPIWSPDGRKLLFYRSAKAWPNEGADTELYVVNTDGSGLVRLTHDDEDVWSAEWSPDGSRVLLVRGPSAFSVDPSKTGGEIFTVRPDGSGLTNISRNPGTDDAPSWSPDAKAIAFYSERRHSFDLYLARFDGSPLRRLTREPGRALGPVWSADGRTLAFTRWLTETTSEVDILELDGRERRIGDGDSYGPVWSPDGTRIAFIRDFELMLYEGGMVRTLHVVPSVSSPILWSPDGTRIAIEITSGLYEPADILVIDAREGGHSNVTQTPKADESLAEWSPNGTELLVVRDDEEILALRADGHGSRRIGP